MPVVTFTAGTSTTPLGKGRDGGVGARGVLGGFFLLYFSVFRFLFFISGSRVRPWDISVRKIYSKSGSIRN